MATAAGRRTRGLPRIKGHEKGAEAVRACVEGCGELKIEFLTLYAFSAENWQRPKTEVFALMRLLETFPERKNAGVAGEKCPAPGDRTPDRFAGQLARDNCTNRSSARAATTG